MHKNLYNFTIKKNKCDITIKSTIKKRTISGEKKELREKERVLPFFFPWITWKEQGRDVERK